MTEAEYVSLQSFFRANALRYRSQRGFLPASLDVDDLVQEALLCAITHRNKFRFDGRANYTSYLYKVVRGRWSNLCARSHFGPSAQTRCHRRKRGLPIDYGEVSLDQGSWPEHLIVDDAASLRRSLPSLTPDQRAEIDRLIHNEMAGISYATTRGKFHVQFKVFGKSVFLGQFRDLEDAKKAKAEALGVVA